MSGARKHKPSKFEALLGPHLMTKVGKYQEKPNFRNFKQTEFSHGPNKPTNEALHDKDLVLLYFSAAWCPPCRSFSPLLIDFYKACRSHDNKEKLGDISIEIVYVSSDRDLDEFEGYYGKMPWLALESQKFKTHATKVCHVSGIPALIVLDRKAHFVTDQARNDVIQAGDSVEKIAQVLQAWKNAESVPLEEAKFSSSGVACAVM